MNQVLGFPRWEIDELYSKILCPCSASLVFDARGDGISKFYEVHKEHLKQFVQPDEEYVLYKKLLELTKAEKHSVVVAAIKRLVNASGLPCLGP